MCFIHKYYFIQCLKCTHVGLSLENDVLTYVSYSQVLEKYSSVLTLLKFRETGINSRVLLVSSVSLNYSNVPTLVKFWRLR